MSNYKSLLNILDQIKFSAPIEYKRYRPQEQEIDKINHARSLALIHLFLKVTFGLLDFNERENFITDGSQDGGIDAYYIDKENKEVTFVQSKFRTSEQNYENKTISLDELMVMDIDRVLAGETVDERGNEYSGKIKQLVRDISGLPDIGKYNYKVALLANIKDWTPSNLRKLTGGFKVDTYDFSKIYSQLVFPVVSGTFYNNSELCISLNLDNKVSSSARISYSVRTEYKECNITVVFVPTEEIGRILYKYKNSILKFNPRCYLEIKSNDVNKDIYETICNKSSNEFALFNNGITALSDETSFNEQIGKKDKAQIVITNPQIINGGQSAFTLSRIYEEVVENKRDPSVFKNKEVLLKIITFEKSDNIDETKKLELIEAISKATNSQSTVLDADRKSNDKIQILIQKEIFNKFGMYYERKKGEFADGVKEKYVDRNQIIDRDLFLRLVMTCDGFSSQARSQSSRIIFKDENFDKYLNDETRVIEYFYAYKFHQALATLEKTLSADKKDPFGTAAYGQSLRYGKFAVTYACILTYWKGEESINNIDEHVIGVLKNWNQFENYAVEQVMNYDYFSTTKDLETGVIFRNYNFDGYYKGRTLNQNIKDFFQNKKQTDLDM